MIKQKLKNFILKYGTSDFFIEQNMCLCSRPDLQHRRSLAGYVGFIGGDFYFLLTHKAIAAVLSKDEIDDALKDGLVLKDKFDIFDRLRKVELFSVRSEDIGLPKVEYFDPHDDYRKPEWHIPVTYDYTKPIP